MAHAIPSPFFLRASRSSTSKEKLAVGGFDTSTFRSKVDDLDHRTTVSCLNIIKVTFYSHLTWNFILEMSFILTLIELFTFTFHFECIEWFIEPGVVLVFHFCPITFLRGIVRNFFKKAFLNFKWVLAVWNWNLV